MRKEVHRRLCLVLVLFFAAGAPLPSMAQQPAPAQALPLQAAPGGGEPAVLAEGSSAPLASAQRVPRELSPWSMFMAADFFVKGVMVGLAFASLVTWTIFLAKSIELYLARRKLSAALSGMDEARTLLEAQLAAGPDCGVIAALLGAARGEMRLSADGGSEAGIKERAASRFQEITRAEARAIRRGMGLLATIGATSPFVGLFGTVWGIMNSFIGISKSQTTNLAVVAPGIAEALLATAIGLVAAIPAVIIYNYFARLTKNHLELVGRGAGMVGRLLSRDLDRTHPQLLSKAAE